MFHDTIFKTHITPLLLNTKSHFESHGVPSDHGYEHACSVAFNAEMALHWQRGTRCILPVEIEMAIYCAALLHDADDRKFFSSANFSNAVAVVTSSIPSALFDNRAITFEQFVALVVEMISLVSASKNKNTVVEDRWKLIPRDADRVEALGGIGVLRCHLYTINAGRPFFTETTPRVSSEEELDALLAKCDFEQYNGNSASGIDHYYDKLLHIGKMSSENGYLQDLADKRMLKMRNFVIHFGKFGDIDHDYIEHLTAKFEGRY
uniref:Putative metal-dependent phosphohydrolase n=1 Tax=Clandestinovirus TaxID=2831644 RepID=A0A8F8PJV5_9VIRU|nr:putative metal-dependent phosphohydrolase [Clandestinovirus]